MPPVFAAGPYAIRHQIRSVRPPVRGQMCARPRGAFAFEQLLAILDELYGSGRAPGVRFAFSVRLRFSSNR